MVFDTGHDNDRDPPYKDLRKDIKGSSVAQIEIADDNIDGLFL